MKHLFIIPSLCLAASFILFSAPDISAQQRAPRRPVFNLKKFEIDDPESPKNGMKSLSDPENAEKWLQVYCEYEVEAEGGWLDNVTFRWNILLLGGETKRLVLTKSITHDKIEADGRETQRSVVYLSPRDIRRYYNKLNRSIPDSKVVVYVEILSDGIKVGEFQYPRNTVRGLPDKWWQSPLVNRFDGVLLSRTESPWAHADHDSWVPERASDKPVAK